MTREVERGTPVVDQFPAFEDDGFTKRSGLGSGDFSSTVFVNGAVEALPVTISEIGSTGEYKTSFTPDTLGVYELQVAISFNRDIWHAQYASVDELTNDVAVAARAQVQKIDQAPTLTPALVVTGSLMDRILNKDGSKTFQQSMASLEAIRDALDESTSEITAPLAQMTADLARVLGLLHQNAILDNQTYDTLGQLTSARLRVFDSAANVPINPGGSETVGLTQQYGIEATYAGLNVVRRFSLKKVL
jgi:hypothetical protein